MEHFPLAETFYAPVQSPYFKFSIGLIDEDHGGYLVENCLAVSMSRQLK